MLRAAAGRLSSSQLFHACEIQLDGSGAAENRDGNLEATVIVIDLLDGAVEVGERTVAMRTCSLRSKTT